EAFTRSRVQIQLNASTAFRHTPQVAGPTVPALIRPCLVLETDGVSGIADFGKTSASLIHHITIRDCISARIDRLLQQPVSHPLWIVRIAEASIRMTPEMVNRSVPLLDPPSFLKSVITGKPGLIDLAIKVIFDRHDLST